MQTGQPHHERLHRLLLQLITTVIQVNNQIEPLKTGDPLVTVEKKLNPDAFLRVHRSFLVNMHHISEIEPWFNSTYNLIMKDGSKIPVSRTYVKELKQRLSCRFIMNL